MKQGTTDWPSTTFAWELMDAYPNAKIILTTRDEDAWLASMNSTLFASDPSPPSFFASFKDFHFGEYETRGEGNVNTKEGFRMHNKNVRKWAKDREREVLEYQVKEGWGPLCGFLGKAVPEGRAFPRSDDWVEKGWKKVPEVKKVTSEEEKK